MLLDVDVWERGNARSNCVFVRVPARFVALSVDERSQRFVERQQLAAAQRHIDRKDYESATGGRDRNYVSDRAEAVGSKPCQLKDERN
jgi:hypothetical protein